MRRFARIAAHLLLSVFALAGLASAALTVASYAGVIKPLVVVSGSMEPAIMTGDLLIDTRVAVEDLAVGDVVSLDSEFGEDLVTHRIIDIQPQADGTTLLQLQGDANESPDGYPYTVTDSVWAPRWQIPGAGYAVTTILNPRVSLPLAVTILALMALIVLPTSTKRSARATHPEAAPAHTAPATTRTEPIPPKTEPAAPGATRELAASRAGAGGRA